MASPQEVGDYPAKACGRGHQVRPGGSGGQGEQVGHKPGLGEDANLQGLDPLLEGLQPQCPPEPKGPLRTREDIVPRELNGEGEDGGDNKPKDLNMIRDQETLQRPALATGPGAEANDGGLAISVE